MKLFKKKETSEQSKSQIDFGEIREKQELDKFRSNLLYAEQKLNPNRNYLYLTYKDVLLDNHLLACMNLRKNKVVGCEHYVYNQDGSVNETITELFTASWFDNFLTYCMDAKFWGNSLIYILTNNEIEVNLVDRNYVIPETQTIRTNQFSNNGESYTNYSNIIDINNENDNYNLGLLLSVSPLAIIKKNSFQGWDQFNQRVGSSIRVGTTAGNDLNRVSKLKNALQNIGKTGVVIKDINDQIEFIESSMSNVDTYKAIVEIINKEISKALVGATEIIDDGGSYSQSLVHNMQFNLITKQDLKWIENIINNKLMPILGYTDLNFKFDNYESLTKAEQFKMDIELLKYYEIDPLYFETTYRVPVKKRIL